MVEYNIVKYCKLCRSRFVVGRRDAKQYYCTKCQPAAKKWQNNQNVEDKK